MGSIVIKIPLSELLDNDELSKLTDKTELFEAKYKVDKGVVEINSLPVTDDTMSILTWDKIRSIIKSGGEVYGYKSYIEVEMEKELPEILLTENEDGEKSKLTWGEWVHHSKPAIERGNRLFVCSDSNEAGYKSKDAWMYHMKCSELLNLMDMDYNVLNVKEFKNLTNEGS